MIFLGSMTLMMPPPMPIWRPSVSWNHELERYERKHLSKKREHYRITAMSYLRRMGKHSNKSFKRLTLKDFESFLGPLDLSKSSIKAVHASSRLAPGG